MIGSTRRRAFSIVELLVVISIIAVLLAILLPMLSGARAAGRAAACGSNLRSVGQALTMYADDNRERGPHWSAWHTYQGDGTGDDTPGPGWAELVEDHLQTLDAMRCADRPKILRTSGGVPVPAIKIAYFLQSRFTALRNAGRLYTSLSVPDVHFADRFVLSGDATNPTLFSSPYGDSPKAPNVDPDDARWQAVFYPNERRPHAGGKYADGGGGSGSSGAIDPDNPAGGGQAASGRAKGEGGANIAFADGHVTLYAEFAPSRMTWHGWEMRDWSSTRP